MMKGKFRLMLSVIFLCISSFSYAEVTDESLNRILDRSGLVQQVGQFPEIIKMGLVQARQQGASLPDAEFNSIVESVDRTILPSEILAEIRASLKESIDEVEAKQLLAWYESDLGKEITGLEERASTPEAYQEMMQSGESLLQDLERLEFAMKFDMNLGLTNMTMDLQDYSGMAVYAAIMTVMQPDTPLDIEPFKAKMKAERQQRREAVKQMVLLSLVYIYKDLDIGRLTKYETFLNDPVTKKFSKTIVDGMDRALKASVAKWADEIAVIFKSKMRED